MADEVVKDERRTGIRSNPVVWELLLLFAQVLANALGCVVVFAFIFGFMRIEDSSMEPRFQNGDLILFYRLDRGYEPHDVAVFAHEGLMTAGRVVALAGDTVNIDSQGLIVNGSYQQEPGITDDTTQVADGVTFPLTVPDGAVFMLGDNRDEAVDSRIVGCVPEDQTLGKVIGLFRRRGF